MDARVKSYLPTNEDVQRFAAGRRDPCASCDLALEMQCYRRAVGCRPADGDPHGYRTTTRDFDRDRLREVTQGVRREVRAVAPCGHAEHSAVHGDTCGDDVDVRIWQRSSSH